MGWLPYVTMFLLGLVGLMLILIILLQRGRGGGLAGALGGMGGQSAFGTKAGDVFTRITIGLAAVWMLLAATNVFALRMGDKKYTGGDDAVTTAPGVESTEGKDKKASVDEMKDIAEKLKQLAADKKDAEKSDETMPATETKTDAETKPADPAVTPEKAPEKPATEKPADEKKPAEDKPAEKPATPEDAPKTEKPAEPAKDGETKPE